MRNVRACSANKRRAVTGSLEETLMLNSFAAACLVAAFALSAPAAFAQTDTSGAPMSDKTMAPKKPMMKHHSMHKSTMAKPMSHPDAMKSGETQQKM
jgi:pentapeptide MXKDX repeat protein